MTAEQVSESSGLDLLMVTIGILTALREEYAACVQVFDPEHSGHEASEQGSTGQLRCWLCSVQANGGGRHVVAITLLSDMGNSASAIAANILLQHCPNILSIIMCGIAGAVPDPAHPDNHVRLGDIVVSGKEGIVEYGRGKQRDPRSLRPDTSWTAYLVTRAQRLANDILGFFRLDDVANHLGNRTAPTIHSSINDPLAGFEYRGTTKSPCPQLLAAADRIHAAELLLKVDQQRRWEYLAGHAQSTFGEPDKWNRPHISSDKLNDSPEGKGKPTLHPIDNSRRTGQPRVFFGPIGSDDVVQADPLRRDALRDRHKVKAIEMEAWGVALAGWIAHVGYIVIRGTCDYCNSTKNDEWRCYAALIAAAYARTVVECLFPSTSTRPHITLFHAETEIAITQQTITSTGDSRRASPPQAQPGLGPAFGTSTAQPNAVPSFDTGDSPVIEPSVSAPNISFDAYSLQIEANVNKFFQIDQLTQGIRQHLIEGRIRDVDDYCLELEVVLCPMARKGDKIRDAWQALADCELYKLRSAQVAGRKYDVTRLRDLINEVRSVVD